MELNLIHMNGRVYDPKLHQFLAPDNFIQDSYNTMSYDRFGYVMNNPLGNVDPSGEFLILAILSGIVRGIRSDGGIKGFFKGFGEDFVNTFKIIGELFAFDSNLTVGQNLLNIWSRFTWELPQTIVGLVYNLGHNLADR